MVASPVYAPALVAFVGVGGVGVAAWFPLGPGEVYRPGLTVRYVNQGVVGAVTVVPRDAFVGARPVARAMVVVPQSEIVQARVVGPTAPIAPVRESVVGAAAVRTPPARVVDRAVFAKTAPPPPRISSVESLRTAGRPALVRGPAAVAARPAVAPVRNDRPPAASPVARPAEQPRTEQPKPAEKKAVKKTEKKDEKK
jgi:hypothetical protein